MTVKKILDWLDYTFRNLPQQSERMFELETPGILENGELYTHIAIAHQLIEGKVNDGKVRSVGIYFCEGEKGENVCQFSVTAYYIGLSHYAVIEATSTNNPDGKSTHFEHYWMGRKNSQLVEGKFQQVESILEGITGRRGVPIPDSHYLCRKMGDITIVEKDNDDTGRGF